ncbi:asparagine synthase-related protein [Brachybacterium sp. GCM10030267]|uniref:asparagine synthase-related protein n=1 Tax=Brachybacterium sp. GCM10030267 TaxID=3273381 RepID=UPI00361D0EF5
MLTPHYKVFVHPEADVHRMENRDGRVVLAIGDIFVAHGELTVPDCLFRLAAGDRRVLDDLSGRFAVFVFDGVEGRLVHDPLGSQSVFYLPETFGPVASHAALLAQCEGLAVSARMSQYMRTDEYRDRSTRFLPGDLTVFDEVKHLIPNNELDLRTGTTARYWPWREARATDFEQLLAVWDEYFASYVSFLNDRYTPVIGLTGGVDSRSVIATLRALGLDARFVTWDAMGADEAARIPKLVEHLAAPHRWIRMSERQNLADLEEIRSAAREAAGFTRGSPVLPAQMGEGADPRDVFVKGLGGEVLRGPFNSRHKAYLPADPLELAYALFAGPVRHRAGALYSTVTRQAINGYLKRANYAADLHGADVGDLVYWEQRMGTWTSVQHAELATTMHSHSAMNSRRLFEAAWGLPVDERFGKELLVRIMRHYDPALAAL